jgi:hypothetical protein
MDTTTFRAGLAGLVLDRNTHHALSRPTELARGLPARRWGPA